jgi:hypothetical protein
MSPRGLAASRHAVASRAARFPAAAAAIAGGGRLSVIGLAGRP